MQCFFGPYHKCSLSTIIDGPYKRLQVLVESMQGERPSETVLPFVTQDNYVWWYALAFTDSQWNRLRDNLSCFIGKSYSTFRGKREFIISSSQEKKSQYLLQQIDREVNQISKGRACRFIGNDKKIWEALCLMKMVYESAPRYSVDIIRPLGRVLRDFYLALKIGDRESAEKELTYLRSKGMISPQNLQFLKVELLKSFQQWNEIVELMGKSDLLAIRRPLAVTGALIEAVYNVELLPFELENQDRAEKAIEFFQEQIWPRYKPLYTARAHLKSPEVIKSFILCAVAINPQQPYLCKELLAHSSLNGHDRAYLKEVVNLLPSKVSSSQLIQKENNLKLAYEALNNGWFDRAISLLKSESHSLERTKILFECAYELQTIESKQMAYEAYCELSQDEEKVFLRFRKYRTLLDELTEKEESEEILIQPRNWLEWMKQLESRDSTTNLKIAKQGTAEWDIDSMFDSDKSKEEFIQLLRDCYDGSLKQELLCYAFPHLISFFEEDSQFPRREYVSIYLSLLELLSLTSKGSENDYNAFNNLAITLVELGLSKEQYNELIEFALCLWDRDFPYNYLSSALELIELFSLLPCPDNDARLRFMTNITGNLPRFKLRLTTDQLKMLQMIYYDLGQRDIWESIRGTLLTKGELDDDEKEEGYWNLLEKKVIGIYTLNEKVAERVKNMIEQQVSNIKVIINSDKSGTDALLNMSRQSDIILVSWACAKHAATQYIKDHCRSSVQTLYPRGKGSSSFLSTLKDYLKGLVIGIK